MRAWRENSWSRTVNLDSDERLETSGTDEPETRQNTQISNTSKHYISFNNSLEKNIWWRRRKKLVRRRMDV